MATAKTKLKKEHLSHAIRVNERAPLWVYLKTKARDLINVRKRHWRSGKLGKKIKHMDKKSSTYIKPYIKKKKKMKKSW